MGDRREMTEAETRAARIDEDLRRAGWSIADGGMSGAVREFPVEGMAGAPQGTGRVDYVPFGTTLLYSKPFVSLISPRVASTNIPRVQMKDLKNLSIPLPPLSTQLRFATFSATLKQSTDVNLENQITRVKTLKNALTQHYFERQG